MTNAQKLIDLLDKVTKQYANDDEPPGELLRALGSSWLQLMAGAHDSTRGAVLDSLRNAARHSAKDNKRSDSELLLLLEALTTAQEGMRSTRAALARFRVVEPIITPSSTTAVMRYRRDTDDDNWGHTS